MDPTENRLPPPLPAPGEVLGPYALFRVAGEGGAAVVYEALDPDGRTVAVKVLRPERAADPVRLAEFAAEAEATRALCHENVVEVLDAGTARGHPYIAMEFVGGPCLTDLLSPGRGLKWRRAARVVLDIARALGHAHARGIVHRDVKPENVLLRPDGRACLGDFGIARDLRATPSPGRPARTAGTAAYASPEQCLGLALSPATDMYSLGATFYALLTGRPPFHGESRSALMRKHVSEAPPPLRDYVPDLPEEIADLVGRMMAKRPRDRVADMRLLARELKTLLAAKTPMPARLARAG